MTLLTKTNKALNKTAVSDESLQSMQIIANAVQQLTASNQTLNLTLLEDAASLLEDMMANPVLFKPLASSNQEFNYNYATALGNLISYATASSQ